MREIENSEFKYYHWDGIHYFFCEYEIELGNIEFDVNKTEIYPIYVNDRQNWGIQFTNLNSSSKKINESTRKLFENMIGNLVLSTKNLILDKYESPVYNNYQYRVSYTTPNRRTLGLANGLYNERKVAIEFETWSPQSIKNRGYDLILFLSKRWNLPLNENEMYDLVFFGLKKPELYD
jgi:hypothetical protein